MADAESKSVSQDIQQPVSATVDGWTMESSDAARPSDAQMLDRMGAESEAPAAEEKLSEGDSQATETEPVAEVVAETPVVEKPAEGQKKVTRATQIQREIAGLTKEKNDLSKSNAEELRRRESIRLEIESLNRERSALAAKPAETKPEEKPAAAAAVSTAGPKPTWAAFEAQGKSYDDYIEALTDWKIADRDTRQVDIRAEVKKDLEQTLSARDMAARAEQDRQAAARASAAIGAQHQSRLAAARTKIPDFDSRLDPTQELSRPMIDCIVRSPLGPETMLYLAEHLDEANEIKDLHPILAVERMGMIRARLEAANSGSAPAAVPSRTRPPIKPVDGASAVTRESSTALDSDFGPEWVAAENRREADARRRRA